MILSLIISLRKAMLQSSNWKVCATGACARQACSSTRAHTHCMRTKIPVPILLPHCLPPISLPIASGLLPGPTCSLRR